MSIYDGIQLAEGPADLDSSFLPFQLFAGEVDQQTGNETVAQFGYIDAYTVMGRRADGKIVPLVPAATDANEGTAARGTLTLTGLPAANDSFTVNGVQIEFVAANPEGNQVMIGATAAATAESLAELLYNNEATFNVVPEYVGGASLVSLVSALVGTAGNATTLVESGANLTVSGATLTGGTAAGATERTPESKVCCVLAAPLDTTAGDLQGPVYRAACFNYQALVWPENITTLAQMKALMDNTKLSVEALK
jgi:hypothetical protein